MSQSHSIRFALGLKDKNITFGEKIVPRNALKENNQKLFKEN